MRLALVALLSCAACGPVVPGEAREDGSGRSAAAIVGGTLATGDPAVVMVAVGNGSEFSSFCSGTLVGPKTVITAAHCVNAYGAGAPYYVVFGSSETSWTQAVSLASQHAHPGYQTSGGQSSDFGVLQLSRAVLDVRPIEMNSVGLEGSEGATIRHVGFGITQGGGNDSGTKREVTYTVRSVQHLTLESGAMGKQTCQGDSGGPAFMVTQGSSQERLVGVVSYGDENCDQYGFDGRVDAVLPWIRQTMAAWETPTCARDGLCKQGCAPIDQDCACAADGQCTAACTDSGTDPDCPRDCGANGICSQQSCPNADVDCAGLGQACVSTVQCQARLCVTDPQNDQPYCSAPCVGNSDCPGTMECTALQCHKKQRAVRAFLDPCSVATDYCTGGVCSGPPGGITRCVKACVSSGDCMSGEGCEGGAGGGRFCRPAGVRFTNIVLPALGTVQAKIPAGCSASGGMPLVLAALAWLLGRRRAS